MPRLFLGKGSYFGYAGRPVFSRLIYPAPIHGGLGVHVTLDLAGRMRFGPDVEWTEQENYDVDPRRADVFYASIRKYFPRLPDGALVPDYAGIRPKLTGQNEAAVDFMIDGPARARRAAPRQSVRHRVAGTYVRAVAGRGGRRQPWRLIDRVAALPEPGRTPDLLPGGGRRWHILRTFGFADGGNARRGLGLNHLDDRSGAALRGNDLGL